MRRVVLGFAVIVAFAASVRADLSGGACSTSLHLVASSTCLSFAPSFSAAGDGGWLAVETVAAPTGWVSAEPVRVVLGPVSPASSLPEDLPAKETDRKITHLPPSPAGDILCLTGLFSIGALQLMRRAQHSTLLHVPEWYQSAGPEQIGRAVSFDFAFSVLPPCAFDRPLGDADLRPAPAYRITRELCARFSPQAILLNTSPRGPPAIS